MPARSRTARRDPGRAAAEGVQLTLAADGATPRRLYSRAEISAFILEQSAELTRMSLRGGSK